MIRTIKPNTTKQVYFWNMSGSMCNALNTILMTMMCSWIVGQETAGIFTIAYSTAQMVQIIGAFELRNIFITDANKRIHFQEILGFEVITNSVMIISSIIFILAMRYTGIEAFSIVVLTFYMVFMNLSDAFGGLFQKNEHLEITGRSLALNVTICTIVFGITLFITRNLVAACASMLVVVILWVTFYDFPYARSLSPCRPSFDKSRIIKLCLAALPLFLTVFIQSYFVTILKYVVEGNLGKAPVAIYGYIFMPAAVINLFSLFLYRPVITTLASDYANKNFKSFYSVIRKELLYIVGLSALAMLGGFLIGAQILGIMYHLDLMPYRWLLVLSLFGGMFNALNGFIYYIFVIMRYQNMILIPYFTASVLITIFAPILVKNFGLTGAFCGYAFGMMLIFIILMVTLYVLVSKAKAREQIPPLN